MVQAFVLISDPEIRVIRQDVGEAVVLDPGATTTFGRAPSCTVRVDVMTVNRTNCGVRLNEQGAWVLEDYGGTNGVFINTTRIQKRHVLRPGDRLHYDNDVTFRFGEVDADPLLQVVPCGPAVALGGAPTTTAGRRRALLHIEGRVTLVTLISSRHPVVLPVGDFEPPALARWEDGGLHHVALLDVRGVDVSHLPDQERRHLGLEGDWSWRDELIATFDGELLLRPGRRSAPSSPRIARRPIKEDFAALVRGLFPEAWAREQLLREQVAVLDAAGLRWLVQRSRDS